MEVLTKITQVHTKTTKAHTKTRKVHTITAGTYINRRFHEKYN